MQLYKVDFEGENKMRLTQQVNKNKKTNYVTNFSFESLARKAAPQGQCFKNILVESLDLYKPNKNKFTSKNQ